MGTVCHSLASIVSVFERVRLWTNFLKRYRTSLLLRLQFKFSQKLLSQEHLTPIDLTENHVWKRKGEGGNQRFRVTHLLALKRVPLVEILLVLVLVHQDEVDAPHAVVEEQRVVLPVEVGLRGEARGARQLHNAVLKQLFLHQVIHDVRREETPGISEETTILRLS